MLNAEHSHPLLTPGSEMITTPTDDLEEFMQQIFALLTRIIRGVDFILFSLCAVVPLSLNNGGNLRVTENLNPHSPAQHHQLPSRHRAREMKVPLKIGGDLR